ncbi:MAG: metal ABC transporter substrate-binding protein [Clostridia bacterium]|nr:metal ABC transporter substrate-binding protein [Clostridia bacterium]
MKGRISIVLMLAIAFSLLTAGCNKSIGAASKTGEKLIVTSFYPMYIFTRNIAKDIPGVRVVNMTEPQTGCLHDYQLMPEDLKLLEKAHIFVANGAGMENFIEKVVEQLPNLKVVEASKGLELLGEEKHEHEQEGKHNDEINPHLWVSITGAIAQVKNIGEQLAAHDSENAAEYKKNMEEYAKKLEALKEKMHNALKGIKNRNIVTFHEAFPYFAKEFDLNIVAVIEREPGTEPGAGELADTIEKIKAAKVKALFAEPQYSRKAAETIARETGAKVFMLDPVVTGPKDADPDSYIKAMEDNLKVLVEALQ